MGDAGVLRLQPAAVQTPFNPAALTEQVTAWWLRVRPEHVAATTNDIQLVHEGLIAQGLWPLMDRFFGINALGKQDDCLMLKIHAMDASPKGVVIQLVSDCYTLQNQWIHDSRWLIQAEFVSCPPHHDHLAPHGSAKVIWSFK